MIKTYIRCNIKRNITLEEISLHTGMNRSSFCIYFKKNTGRTLITYINEQRIELACTMLKEKKMNISDICFSCGFSSVPYFNRVFKQIKGTTPGDYASEN